MATRYRPDNWHSRLVGLLKIALPLAALAILSTLFLLSRTINPEDAIPYATVDVAERAREPRITNPTYAGVTADGASIAIAATEARPQTGTAGATAKALVGTLDTPDGSHTEFAAATLEVDDTAKQAILGGGVTLTSSNGWSVATTGLIAAFDQTSLASTGPVTAQGPAGTLAADAMQITEDPARPGAYLLVFKGGVKLLYQPPK